MPRAGFQVFPEDFYIFLTIFAEKNLLKTESNDCIAKYGEQNELREANHCEVMVNLRIKKPNELDERKFDLDVKPFLVSYPAVHLLLPVLAWVSLRVGGTGAAWEYEGIIG